MTRPQFLTRTIRLVGRAQLDTVMALVPNLPIDPEKPLELVVREEKKTRKLDQNAAMWVGPLKDIADQAWVDGRQFRIETWHEFYKREYLPEDNDSELDLLVKDGYRKWDIDPHGDRVLVGSTTQLTVRGFALYLQQVEAYGASLGVVFHTKERHENRNDQS